MSAGQAIGGIAGAVIGFYVGGVAGAMAGFSLGAGIGGALDPADVIGPRQEDLKTQMSSYGSPIPFEWGTNRHAGTIIWPRELNPVETYQSESEKGGPDVTTYHYSISCAVLIGEGPIIGIRRIWANKKIVYDASPGNVGAIQDPVIGSVRFHLGTEDQEVDPLIEATDGASPAYRGYAYVVFENYDVTEMQGRPPLWEFEVLTGGDVGAIGAPVSYGESYGTDLVHPDTDKLMHYDVDPITGHLWLSTMTGHAVWDTEALQYVIDPGADRRPQIQEYDPVTRTLLGYRNLEVSYLEPDSVDISVRRKTYGISEADACPAGGLVACGGLVFTAIGQPGWVYDFTDGASNYLHGLVVDTELGSATPLTSICSAGQFQNGAWWPTIPVPVLDGNLVYIASGNGIEAQLAIAWRPAGIAADPLGIYGEPTFEDYWPIPTFDTEPVRWTVPVGWGAARPDGATFCPPSLDVPQLIFPYWALKQTVVTNPNGCIVQGYKTNDPFGDGSRTWLAWVTSPRVDGSGAATGPSDMNDVELPAISPSTMPSIVFDAENSCIWAFVLHLGNFSSLFKIPVTGSGIGTPVDTGFALPFDEEIDGSGIVAASTLDETTGKIRLLFRDGELALFDPVDEVIVESIQTGIETTMAGKMWDYPDAGKLLFTDGYTIWDIPYRAALTPGAVPLSTIVSDLCLRSGLAADDIDVTALTDLVDGYIIPRQMTARTAIEQLQTAFYFDKVESDDKIKFVKRGGDLAGTILAADRAAHEAGQSLPPSLALTRAFDLELPYHCEVTYPDLEADHQPGAQYDRRLTKDTRSQLSIQLGVVMTAEKAKEIARTALYDSWQTQSFNFTTTRKYAKYEPTDIVALPTDEASYRVMLTDKREQPNGVIEWTARIQSAAVYTQTGEDATPTPHTPQEIYAPGETLLHLLDMPILRDADDNPGWYVAMGGEAAGWTGATLCRSTDGGVNFLPVFSTTSDAVIGGTIAALPDFPNCNIFDEGSTLTVTILTGGALTSATEDEVFNGANMAVVGVAGRWEVVQFKNATLVGAGRYELSGFLRGRRGTEWATSTHFAGDTFILANASTWNRVNAGDTGLSRVYKAPPTRIPLSDVDPTTFIGQAIGLKPFSPVDAVGERDGGDDLTITWARRTRLAAGTLYLPTLLGEATEAYEIDVMLDDEVVRTIDATTMTATYLASEQTADGITPGDPVTVRIHQLSATVGRGYPLEVTL